jgi:hypothetical protein
MSNLPIQRIGHALGAKITGVDLRKPLDDAAFGIIKRASLEHLLLCFPQQDLTREQMIAFAGRFGVVDDNSSVKHRDPKKPYVTMISSKPFEGKPWESFKNGENWHTDRSFKVGIPSYTRLHAQELPPVGGSGSSSALLRRRPLRTGRESRPSSGSSHSSAPRRCDTELSYRAIYGSTVSEVRYPLRVERIGQRADFYVSRDQDRHCAEEPKSVSLATNRAIRCKYRRPVSISLEVFISNPPCPFRRMSTHSPTSAANW